MGRTPRILVIDDDRLLCELVRTTFELEGFEVDTAYDVIEAERVLVESRPDAILLDIGLPGIDGYETARRLRAVPALSGAYFVALTGYGQEEDRRKAQEAGFDLHVVKPIRAEALMRLLSAHRRGSPAARPPSAPLPSAGETPIV